MRISEEEKDEMISMVDNYNGVQDIINLGYKRLDLITFYTVNENEANARAIQRGSNVKESAGVVHTKFEENFVAAEVINADNSYIFPNN